MKKQLLALSAAAVLLAPQAAGAEGFAINEWSAEGVAMGGARMFAEGDAANIAYNPASITKVEGEAFKQSAVYISPHGKYSLFDKDDKPIENEPGKNVVHAAWVPGGYYVKQINDKEWFGIGAYTRFGMISEFERNSTAATNAFFSKLVGVSVTPTYAHKFDKKWSAAVGAEINYVGLDLEKNLTVINGFENQRPTIGRGATHLDGESYALGWNAAVNYAFDDKNEIGVVYRSEITHSMEATFNAYGDINKRVNAYGVVTLPDSWSIGYNHKFDDKTRVELNATRTGWSSYDALNISFDGPLGFYPNGDPITSANSAKNWSDGWRYAIGIEHKLSDKYSLMAGFAYDESSIPYNGGDFIVPTGDRRTYSIGAQYHDKDQTLAMTLGWMDIGGLDFAGGQTDGYSSAHTYDNYAKIFGISYQRNF